MSVRFSAAVSAELSFYSSGECLFLYKVKVCKKRCFLQLTCSFLNGNNLIFSVRLLTAHTRRIANKLTDYKLLESYVLNW